MTTNLARSLFERTLLDGKVIRESVIDVSVEHSNINQTFMMNGNRPVLGSIT